MTNGEPEIRTWVDAGALLRRHVRAQLDFLGIHWTEHKGLFESTFIVYGTRPQMDALNRWIRRVNA